MIDSENVGIVSQEDNIILFPDETTMLIKTSLDMDFAHFKMCAVINDYFRTNYPHNPKSAGCSSPLPQLSSNEKHSNES